MPRCWYVLLRFFLRAYHVLVRLREARLFCQFSPPEGAVVREVFKVIIERKRSNGGKLDSMVFQGPQPFLGVVPFNRSTVWRGGQTYVYIDMHGCFKDDLAPFGGKVFCYACNTNTNVRCKGPMMSRIRQIPDIPAPCNVLYEKFVCENCPAAPEKKKHTYFYSHQEKMWDALRRQGLDHIPDSIPWRFTRKFGVGRSLLDLMKDLSANAVSMQVISNVVHEQLFRNFGNLQAAFYSKHALLQKFQGKLNLAERTLDRENFGDWTDKDGYAARVPSHSYISSLVKAALEEGRAEREACLASVGPGTRGVIAFDFTHQVTKYIWEGGDRMFTGVLTGINDDGEPLLCQGSQSASVRDMKEVFMELRDTWRKLGYEDPRVIYVDWLEGMAGVLQEVWPNAIIKQDIWHVIDRFQREIPADHSLKRVFLAEVSSLFLVLYKEDAYLLERYMTEKQVQRVLTTAKEFKDWYKRNGGRWATPPGEVVAANLEALLEAWEAKDTVCIETGRDLITPKLRELTRRTAALAKEGHLQDPFLTPEMYYVDAKGNQRTIRSTSQLESLNRVIGSCMPGTHMGVEGAHMAIVCALYNLLVRVRPQTRPAEYAKHPVIDHTFLNKINKLAVRAGVRAPYKDTTRPAPGVTQDMFRGGFLSAPTSAMCALDEAGKLEAEPSNMALLEAGSSAPAAAITQAGSNTPAALAIAEAGSNTPAALAIAEAGSSAPAAVGVTEAGSNTPAAAMAHHVGLSPHTKGRIAAKRAQALATRAAKEAAAGNAAVAAQALQGAALALSEAEQHEMAAVAATSSPAARPKRTAAIAGVHAAAVAAGGARVAGEHPAKKARHKGQPLVLALLSKGASRASRGEGKMQPSTGSEPSNAAVAAPAGGPSIAAEAEPSSAAAAGPNNAAAAVATAAAELSSVAAAEPGNAMTSTEAPARKVGRSRNSRPASKPFGKKAPIKVFYPLSPSNDKHMDLFLQLLPDCTSRGGGSVDYKRMEGLWLRMYSQRLHAGTAGTLVATHARYLKEFHEEFQNLQREQHTFMAGAMQQGGQSRQTGGQQQAGEQQQQQQQAGGQQQQQQQAGGGRQKNQGGKGVKTMCQGCRCLNPDHPEVELTAAHRGACPWRKQWLSLYNRIDLGNGKTKLQECDLQKSLRKKHPTS